MNKISFKDTTYLAINGTLINTEVSRLTYNFDAKNISLQCAYVPELDNFVIENPAVKITNVRYLPDNQKVAHIMISFVTEGELEEEPVNVELLDAEPKNYKHLVKVVG